MLWTATLWLARRMRARDEPRYWLAIGAAWGVGMENKYSMLLPAAGLVLTLLLIDPVLFPPLVPFDDLARPRSSGKLFYHNLLTQC